MALALVLIIYVLVALAHAYLAPLTTGPDELAHYEYANFIAEHGRLPLNTAERAQASYKSDQPPLYHFLVALPAGLVDIAGPPYLKRVSDHPRRQLIERNRHAWGLYNTEDEQPPYRGEVLRWQIGRWIAILFGAATVAVTFFTARDLFDRLKSGRPFGPPPWLLALSAAAIVAFIPRFALTGTMLNYETTLALFASLFLWSLLRLTTQSPLNTQAPNPPTSPSSPLPSLLPTPYSLLLTRYSLLLTPYSLLLGLFTGLAITTKLSALILPVEIVIALYLIGRYRGWPWRQQLGGISVAALATLAAAGWWFGFLFYQFNTVAQDGWWTGLLRPLVAADSSDATTNRLLSLLTGGQAGFTAAIDNLDSGPPWEWLAISFKTFWAVEIEEHQPLGLFGLLVALAFCLLAVWGLWLVWRRERERRLILSLLLLHLFLPLILPFARYITTFSLADTAQGRHVLFMAAPAFALLLVWGLTSAASHSALTPNPSPGIGRGEFSFLGGRRLVMMTPWWCTKFVSTPYVLRFTLYIFPLFLLFWTGLQLWTMTWAYIPLLPVRTLPLPEADRQIVSSVADHRVNEFVTLLGYRTQPDLAKGLLRIDLWWQATGLSPTDYLTEINLLDAQGEVRSQWLGHTVNGRYPTRAWDVGDTIRDTAWLPIGGLEAGSYHLMLSLLSTSLNGSFTGAPPTSPVLNQTGGAVLRHAEEPNLGQSEGVDLSQVKGIELGPITLANEAEGAILSQTEGDAAEAAGGPYTLWQNGEAVIQPQTFRYRETILVTFSPAPPGQTRQLAILPLLRQAQDAACSPAPPSTGSGRGLLSCLSYAPLRQSDSQALFIVGPDWPSSAYQLQASLTGPNQAQQQVHIMPLFQVMDLWQRQFSEPPITHRLEANFANQIKLLGYDLAANRAEPGGGIPLTLYWQGLDWLGDDYTIFAKLLSADQIVYGGRERLPREGYRTLYWAPGEIVTDPFGAPVRADAPAGIYHLNIGLYKLVNGQAYSLPLVQDGQPLEANSIDIGPIKIGAAPAGLTLERANPQVSLNQPFGDTPHLSLLGYDLTDENNQPISELAKPIQNLKLRLYWRSEAALPTDYTTFVHLLNPTGETVAQKDQPPLNGAYPTSLWDPGEIIADEIIIPLPPDLAGSYDLIIGMYDFKSGARLIVPAHPENSLKLTRLELP